MELKRRPTGFTLLEAIVSIVLLGIISSVLAVFIAKPVQGYIDTVRRARITDVADLALKRMGLEIRTAVPNTVRLSFGATPTTSCTASATGCFLEFIPARNGGRYCTDTNTGCNALSYGPGSVDTSFDVLGPATDAAVGEYLVIYNTGQTGLDAYAGSNRRTIAAGTTTSAITFSLSAGTGFTYGSPSNRFQIVPTTQAVTFACEGVGGTTNGTGSLNRYDSYGFNAAQATSGLGTARLLADYVSACQINYNSVSARDGIVAITLTITRETESVTLLNQIHVYNMP